MNRDDAERREHLQMRMSGLTRAVGDMEPGAREFCLAAIGEWADYTGELRDRIAELEAEVERLRALLSEAVNAGIVFEDPRLDYKEVQVDVRWFSDARKALADAKLR
jgi:hypothetical protein